MTHSTETPTPAASGKEDRPLLRLGLELGPLALFFVANRYLGTIEATGILMVATLVALALSKRLLGHLPLMPVLSCIFLSIFGGMTLLFNDDLWIKLKPSVFNGMMGATLLGGMILGKPLLKLALGNAMALTDTGWRILSLRWGIFFLVLAGLNELVWRTQSSEFWAGFKLFGMAPLGLAFGLSQLPTILRHQLPPQEPAEKLAAAEVQEMGSSAD